MSPAEKLWPAVAASCNREQLAAALGANQPRASTAISELLEILDVLDEIFVSKAIDQLRWLGIELAEAAGDRNLRARLAAQRLQSAAMTSIQAEDKVGASEMLFSAAAQALEDKNIEQLVRVNHYSILFLFRLGEWDAGLKSAEAMLAKAEEHVSGNQRVQAVLYEFSQVTKFAPAGDRWAHLLARLSATLRKGGNSGFATAVDCRLAETLMRCGACEDAMDLLADLENPLARLMVRLADGREKMLPEYGIAARERARGFMLMGRDVEAESAYRALLKDPEFHIEATTRLADLLFQSDRLQEALDLVQSIDERDSRLAAHASSIVAVCYSRLNRQEASLAAADQAKKLLNSPEERDAGLSDYRQKVRTGLHAVEKIFAGSELGFRTELNLIESGLLRRDAPAQHASALGRILDWARGFGERSIEARCLRIRGEIAMAAGNCAGAVKDLEIAIERQMVPSVSHEWKNLRQDDTILEPYSIRLEQWKRRRIEAGVSMDTQLSLGRAKIECSLDPTEELDLAIAGARRRWRRLVLYYALAAKGRYLRLRGERDVARTVWNEAADVLESIRANLDGIEAQVGVLEDKELAYAELLEIAADDQDPVSALRTMERAKSRALLEQMSVRRDAPPLDPSDEQQAREFRQSLIRYFNRNLVGDGQSEVGLLELKRSFAKLYRGPALDQFKRRAAARPEEVAAVAQGDTAVLEYFVTDDHMHLAIVRDGKPGLPMRLDLSRNALEMLMASLRFEIATRDRCYSLKEFYGALIEPVAELLEHALRLVIVPHGPLHSLPFHAFQRSDGKYLGQLYSVLHAPSIAVARLASEQWGRRENGRAVLLAGNETPYSPLPTLEDSETEIEEIARHLAGSTLFKGRNASRRELMQVHDALQVLHLSCHGEFDPDDPLLSRIYLSDGPIYGYEVERLQCRPRLAVLSACDTALQRRTAGDETFGLVRAFLTKGAETVVASLWKVADESTAVLMGKFYEALLRDDFDVPAALRSAQRHLLSMPEYAHPFFWAPYVAIGGSNTGNQEERGVQ